MLVYISALQSSFLCLCASCFDEDKREAASTWQCRLSSVRASLLADKGGRNKVEREGIMKTAANTLSLRQLLHAALFLHQFTPTHICTWKGIQIFKPSPRGRCWFNAWRRLYSNIVPWPDLDCSPGNRTEDGRMCVCVFLTFTIFPTFWFMKHFESNLVSKQFQWEYGEVGTSALSLYRDTKINRQAAQLDSARRNMALTY